MLLGENRFDILFIINSLSSLSSWRGKTIQFSILTILKPNVNFWGHNDLKPVFKHALDCFGWERCLFGCDWPVFELLNNCDITNVYEIVERIVKRKYDESENISEIFNAIFYKNAIKVYKLKMNPLDQ